jgi:hypothetical protein
MSTANAAAFEIQDIALLVRPDVGGLRAGSTEYCECVVAAST